MDGLQVYDVSDPYNPVRTAYFDTHNQEPLGGPYPSLAYQGAWGAYPFFSSGNIAVSDMQNGLFVLQQLANGINNITSEDIAVYPNPVFANQGITISNLMDNNQSLVELYDLLGHLVFSTRLQVVNNTLNLRIPEIASGLYVLKIGNGSKQLSKKLIIR
jgi:hypothetical protein